MEVRFSTAEAEALLFSLFFPFAYTSLLNMASCNSQTDKPQHGCPKRAELLDVNVNTGTQRINTESFFKLQHSLSILVLLFRFLNFN